jgi:hypothetical protein
MRRFEKPIVQNIGMNTLIFKELGMVGSYRVFKVEIKNRNLSMLPP